MGVLNRIGRGETLEQVLRSLRTKVDKESKWFIAQLVKHGIPRKAIATSDFSSSSPAIYITIPYGKPGGGRHKRYERWNSVTAKSAIKWWRETTKK